MRSAGLRRTFLGAAALLFVAGGLLFLGAPEQEVLEAVGADAALREVALHRVGRQPVRARVEVAGVLEARRSVQLFAETRGPVIEVGAEALDRVEAGQVLARIDPLLAEVAVERSRASLARAESELSLARSTLERRMRLAEQGVASDADLEDAQNAEKVAQAALRQARAELKQARDDLAKKQITAPFTGVLRSFHLEQGEYVQDGDELGELLDLSAARARIGLSDREVVEVAPGQPVEARVAARPAELFRGRILRVGAASDRETRKFPVEVEFANADGLLLPGMVATVALDLGPEAPRTVIPAEAVLEEFGLRFVWVIESDHGGLVVRRRRVELRPLPFAPGRVEVLSGLDEGATIAVTSTRELREGERVRADGVGSP